MTLSMQELTTTTPPPTPSFAEESGSFLLSRFGKIFALGFKGSHEFVQRSHAWAINTGLARGELRWAHATCGETPYVTVKDRARLTRAITDQIRADIVMRKEVKPLEDRWDNETESPVTVWDESQIDELAASRAEQFFASHIKLDNFMAADTRNARLAPVYTMADQQWRGFQCSVRS